MRKEDFRLVLLVCYPIVSIYLSFGYLLGKENLLVLFGITQIMVFILILIELYNLNYKGGVKNDG